MKSAHVLLSAAILATGHDFSAHAHSWYPKECCSQMDCRAADAFYAAERGGQVVVVGQIRIWLPADFAARPSPDGQVHICFRVAAGELYGEQTILPFCLFLPAQS